MPLRLAIRQFKRFYGAAYYYGTARRRGWPTRDGIIPWRLFFLEYADIYATLALERLNIMDAVKLGVALAAPRSKSDPKLEQLVDNHLNEAFPKE